VSSGVGATVGRRRVCGREEFDGADARRWDKN
jgi:hypothetical protein